MYQQLDFGYPPRWAPHLRASPVQLLSPAPLHPIDTPPASLPRMPQSDRRVRDPRASANRGGRASVGRNAVRPARDIPYVEPIQLDLPLPSPIVLTSAMRDIERYLVELARVGGELWGNARIGAESRHCRGTVRTTLELLVRLQRVDIQIEGNRRRCHMRAIGKWTSWGDIRPTRRCALPEAASRPVSNVDLITASMEDVRRVVSRIANAGDQMPNNPILGELAGGRGRSSALRALRRLVRARVLRIEVTGSTRRAQVVSTGRWTGWGEARPGHAPYLHRARGAPVLDTPKVRKPDSRPLAACMPISSSSYARLEAVTGYADECQYGTWEDGCRPGPEPRFCGAPSARGSSFCATHTALCFPHRKRGASRPARPARASPPVQRHLSVKELLAVLAQSHAAASTPKHSHA